MAQNEKEQNDYRITYYNAVSSKEVDWLWYPYIPYGKITILQGDPGEIRENRSDCYEKCFQICKKYCRLYC